MAHDSSSTRPFQRRYPPELRELVEIRPGSESLRTIRTSSPVTLLGEYRRAVGLAASIELVDGEQVAAMVVEGGLRALGYSALPSPTAGPTTK